MNDILTAIQNRIREWKKIFCTDLAAVNEDSSWLEILLYAKRTDYPYLLSLIDRAIYEVGVFTDQERTYLRDLPAYYDIIRASQIFDAKVYIQRYLEDIPIVVCTVETEKEELWDLDILLFTDTHPMYLIINYAKEVPIFKNVPEIEDYQQNVIITDCVPKDWLPVDPFDDLPF